MKTLKAKHKKSYYKNENAWLKAVYKNNKEVIDKTLGSSAETKKSKYSMFKKLVKEMKEDRYLNDKYDGRVTTVRAVEGLARSEIFTSAKERITGNALKSLKKDKELYKKFRRLTGWNSKVDTANFEWNKTLNGYIYRPDNENGVSVVITFTGKSPVTMSVEEL